jgi:RecA/RadA recombinase/intein/homing endonuclease
MIKYTDEKVQFFSSGSTLLNLALGGGWALKRVFNIVGDKSAGKCVRNAYIIDQSGIELIDDVGKLFDYGSSIWNQQLGFCSSGSTSCTLFHKEKVNRTSKVTTRHGYSIEGKPEHPLLCFTSECEFVFRKIQDLQVGDYVVIAKEADLIQRTPPVLCSLPPRGPLDYHTEYCKVPNQVTKELARILGLFVADGNFSLEGGELRWTNDASWFSSILIQDCESCFGVAPIKKPDIANNTQTFSVSRVQLHKWLDCIFEGKHKDFTGRTKFIPKVILRSPKETQIEFLRSLIDCDSWFDYKGSMIEYSTASEVLANQVQLLLLNLGVVSTRSFDDKVKGYEGHKYWDVCISGKQLKHYLEVVGTNREEVMHPTDKDKSEYDSIPFIKQRILSDIANCREKTGWTKNGKTRRGYFPIFQLSSSENVSFPFLKNQFISKFSNSNFSEFFDWNFYNFIGNCNFHFDPVESIESLDYLEGVDVHDVHVPTDHRFWSNGFISHNTGLAIEAFANFKQTFQNPRMRYAEAEAAFDEVYGHVLGFPEEVERPDDLLNTVEDFQRDFFEFISKPGPSLYILDSLDALSDEAELKKFEKEVKARSKAAEEEDEITEVKGDFGVAKAKKMSKLFRMLNGVAAEANCSLGIISQTRENIGVMFGEKQTRSGGKALDFYASQILWLRELKKIEKTVMGEQRAIGVSVKGRVKKCKVGLPFREADFNILFGYGIDDESSMLNWLLHIKQIGETAGKQMRTDILTARDKRDFVALKEISDQLKADTTRVWYSIEDQLAPKMRKYGEVLPGQVVTLANESAVNDHRVVIRSSDWKEKINSKAEAKVDGTE